MEWLFEDFVKSFKDLWVFATNVVIIPEKVGNILFWFKEFLKKMEQ